jgi:hypothetical protein
MANEYSREFHREMIRCKRVCFSFASLESTAPLCRTQSNILGDSECSHAGQKVQSIDITPKAFWSSRECPRGHKQRGMMRLTRSSLLLDMAGKNPTGMSRE